MIGLEKVINGFQEQLKKGFYSILVLHSLKIQPNHGYQVAKDIKKRTNKVWSPPPSSVSRTLRQLKKKGLVEITEVIKTGRVVDQKKYTLTKLGERALTLSLKETKDVVEAMRSVLITIFGMGVDFSFDLYGIDLTTIDTDIIADLDAIEKQVDERIDYLQDYKQYLKEQFLEIGIKYLEKEKGSK